MFGKKNNNRGTKQSRKNKNATTQKNNNRKSQQSQRNKSFAAKKKVNTARTKSGKVPQGRTLKTLDKYLDKSPKEPDKERPVVVIESSDNNDLAVVTLSTQKGTNRTRLPNYQQGQSYFKHFVEIEDVDGNPIRVNDKFKENHPNMDVSRQDVDTVIDTVFNHSKPMAENRKKIKNFRNRKK